MNQSRVSAALIFGGLFASSISACSAAGGASPAGAGAAGGSAASLVGTSGSPTGGVPGAGSGVSDPGAGGGDVMLSVGPGASPTSTDAGTANGACGSVEKPEQIFQYSPIALYIMLDRSGSMVTGFPEGSAQSWQNSTNAINGFLSDPSTQSIDVGLGFFPTAPDNGFTCGDGTGSGASCGTPIVEIGPTSQNASKVSAAMTSQSNQPNALNLTPTECALIGMVSHCEEWTKKTGEQCVAILVTDGNPTLCNGDPTALAKIVSDGKAAGVTTFVLGLPGSNATLLDPLAQAGGSGTSIDVSGGASAFNAALNGIRGKVSVGTALPCQWKIPAPPAGQVFNPEKVNVRFTAQGGAPQDFGYVNTQADCAHASNAWYFDDVNQPTQVLVCPTTCDMLKASQGAEVDVSFGCARKPATIQ
jgi:hypothetical protein